MARTPPSLGLLSGWPLGIALVLGSGVAFVIVVGWQAGRGARWCGIIVHSSAAPGEEGLSGRVWLGWAAHIILVGQDGSFVVGSCSHNQSLAALALLEAAVGSRSLGSDEERDTVNKLGMTEVEARTAKSFEPPA